MQPSRSCPALINHLLLPKIVIMTSSAKTTPSGRGRKARSSGTEGSGATGCGDVRTETAGSTAVLNAVLDQVSDAVAIVRRGRFLRVNRRFLDIFGLEKEEEVIHKPLAALPCPEDGNLLAGLPMGGAGTEGLNARFEARVHRGQGEPVSVEISRVPTDYGGKRASLYVLKDLSGRKQLEEKLRQSEAAQRLVFSASPVGIVFVGPGMTITGINHRIHAMTGYGPEELVGRPVSVLFGADQEGVGVERVVCGDARECGLGSADARWVRKDGEARDVYVSAAPLDPVDPSLGLVLTAVDITRRKDAEEKLAESEERYRTAIEQSNDGVSMMKDGIHVYVNRKFLAIFGYDRPEEVIGKSNMLTIHPDDREMVSLYNVRRGRGLDAPTRYEFKGVKKDGMVVYIEVSATGTSFRGDRVVLSYLRDVTDRKRMEEEVKRSVGTLRSVLAVVPLGVGLLTSGRIMNWVSDYFTAISGYTREEVTGRNARMLYPSDEEFKRVGQVVYGALKERKIGVLESRWVHKEGRLLDVFLAAAPIDPKDLSVGIVFASMDITERKRMEEAIRKSEEKYRDIFERAAEGIFQNTARGVFLSANPAFARMLGYSSPEEFMAEINNGLYRPVVHRRDLVEYGRALNEDGRVEGFEMQVRRRDGCLLWVMVNSRKVEDPRTQAVYYEGTVEDVTRRKVVEMALRESEKRYKNLFEYANDAIFLVHRGRFVNCNPKALEMFGCGREELIGASVHAFGPPFQPDGSESERVIAEKVRAARSGKPQFFEWRHCRKDGTTFDSEVSLSILEVREKSLILSIERDITDRKRSQAMLARALSELESKNRELHDANRELKESQKKIIQQEKMASIGQLAAGVAHEINNPMGFIISNLNSLEKYTKRISEFVGVQDEAIESLWARDGVRMEADGAERPGTKSRKALKIDYILEDSHNLITESLDGANRVKQIVQDLKSFSHVDGSGHASVDMNRTIESTLNIVWNELKYKATVRREYGTVPTVTCNAGQIGQVFMNLLLNASQAIEETGEITVRTWNEETYVCVAIADTGCGIPEDQLNRIFEPFFTTKEVGKGTGLGLSIAYDIVKKHKGEIEVASEVGKGTTFTLRIPADVP